jgi:hypothetical protein
MMSFGNTGIITPSASMSSATVMKTNRNAARVGVGERGTETGGVELIVRHATLEAPCKLA